MMMLAVKMRKKGLQHTSGGLKRRCFFLAHDV